MKRALSLVVLIMVISNGATTFGQALISDYEKSWAKKEINYMMEKCILSGYADGTFRPDNNIKKSEFYKIINGLMGFTNRVEVGFRDIKPTDWYYGQVEKGLAANYILVGKSLEAEENITRGEVARIIGIVFGIKEDEAGSKAFADNENFSKSLKGVIGGLKKKGLIKGYPDNTFRPTESITRAEVVKMLYDISGEIINVAGEVSKSIKTNLVVNTSDVVLKDMTIEGDLYLTEGIGNGDITLDNVVIKGELNIKGGGPNSIIIKNSKINTVVIDKKSGLIRAVFDNTTVEEVRTVGEVKMELRDGTLIKLVELGGKVELILAQGTTIDLLDVLTTEIVIKSKGTIRWIKSSQYMIINGEMAKAHTVLSVIEGQIIWVRSYIKEDYIGRVISDTTASVQQSEVVLQNAAVLQDAAETAVLAYEVAPITTLEQVAIAEGLKSLADLAVEAVEDVNVKAIFESRITNRVVVIALARTMLETEVVLAEATASVEMAETSKTDDARTKAQELVIALPDGEDKINLQVRLDSIVTIEDDATITLQQAKINAKEALNIYVNANNYTISLLELSNVIETGKIVIDQATTIEEVDTALINAKVVIDKIESDCDMSLKQATASVEMAETSKTDDARTKAQELVIALPDGEDKINLQVRLDSIVTIEDDAIKLSQTIRAVEKCELSKLQADVDAAQWLVTALGMADVKGLLQARITVVQNIINAEAAVSAYEETPITTLDQVVIAEGLGSAADLVVATVEDIAVREAFKVRIKNRSATIASAIIELDIGEVKAAKEALILTPASSIIGYSESFLELINPKDPNGWVIFTLAMYSSDETLPGPTKDPIKIPNGNIRFQKPLVYGYVYNYIVKIKIERGAAVDWKKFKISLPYDTSKITITPFI